MKRKSSGEGGEWVAAEAEVARRVTKVRERARERGGALRSRGRATERKHGPRGCGSCAASICRKWDWSRCESKRSHLSLGKKRKRGVWPNLMRFQEHGFGFRLSYGECGPSDCQCSQGGEKAEGTVHLQHVERLQAGGE